MARRTRRPTPTHQQLLEPVHRRCPQCEGPLWAVYYTRRTVTTLSGVYRLTLHIRRCITPTCPRFHQPYRPEEEGAWALPHGEFGFDVIALIGRLRYAEHRSVPEIHQRLLTRGIPLAERTVTYLVDRYEELITLRLADHERLRALLSAQGQVILALDGLQPDRGHEVLWVVRDCLSGEVLLARSLLSAIQRGPGRVAAGSQAGAAGAGQWHHLRRAGDDSDGGGSGVSQVVNIRNRRIESRFIALQSHKLLLDLEMRL